MRLNFNMGISNFKKLVLILLVLEKKASYSYLTTEGSKNKHLKTEESHASSGLL